MAGFRKSCGQQIGTSRLVKIVEHLEHLGENHVSEEALSYLNVVIQSHVNSSVAVDY